MKPSTKYTKSGRINIAYQVFGSGSVDLVYIPGWVSNIDWMWACPELVNFLQELATICRVILFDKRGTGLSDRVTELSTIEERMDDIRAVMDAVNAREAILFGHSEGGSVSALFAATYPHRTIALITFGVFAKRRYSPDYPWAPTDAERQLVYDMIENSWGSGDMNLASLAPSKAHDKNFMDWLANYFRSGASPSAAMVLTRMNTQVDIIDILGSIKVPTLLMQRTHDIDVKIEEGRFIAGRIAEARFVELDGDDHLFWVGNTAQILAEMRNFILNVNPAKNYEVRLYTILAARIVADTMLPVSQHGIIDQTIAQYRGRIIEHNHDRVIATFEGPSKAVHCGIDLVDALMKPESQLIIGIHIREGAVDEAHFISDTTQEFIDSILQHGRPNQILITQTVKHLLSGAGLNFTSHETVLSSAHLEPLSLFRVTDRMNSSAHTGQYTRGRLPKNDSSLKMSCKQSTITWTTNHLGWKNFAWRWP